MTLPNGLEVATQLSNPIFKAYLIKELKEVSNQFTEYLWSHALYLVRHPLSSHLPSLLPLHSPISISTLEWWSTFSDHYGYGIFHERSWDQTIQSYTVVSVFHYLILCNYLSLFDFPRCHLDINYSTRFFRGQLME